MELRWRRTISSFSVCKAQVHKQHPISVSLGTFRWGSLLNVALLCIIYDKICLFNSAVVRISNSDSFFPPILVSVSLVVRQLLPSCRCFLGVTLCVGLAGKYYILRLVKVRY